MGRPKTYQEERVQVGARFPESLYRRLQDEAERRDTSVNFLVCRALETYLDNLPPLDPEFERMRCEQAAGSGG